MYEENNEICQVVHFEDNSKETLDPTRMNSIAAAANHAVNGNAELKKYE